jgi:hypothetical protein
VVPHIKRVADEGYDGRQGEERKPMGLVENKGVRKGGWVHGKKKAYK